MPHDGQDPTAVSPLMADLGARVAALQPSLDALQGKAIELVRGLVTQDGRVSPSLIDRHQRAAHGLAWLATYVEALRQMGAWAERLGEAGTFGEMEGLILQIGAGEYLAQILGGIPMTQGEILRPSDIGLSAADLAPLADHPLLAGNSPAARARLVTLMRDNHGRATFGATGLDDELEMIR
ncbi:MAG: acyl-CoA dehydrogenase, partial [Pararhodobacter sp.]